MKYSAVLAIALSLSAAGVEASPFRRATAQDLKNGQDAIALNDQFKTMQAGQTCTTGQQGCINGGFAECANGKMVSLGCAGGTTCAALPVTGGAGTAIACTTQADIDARLAATGATSASSSSVAVSSAAASSAAASSVAVSSAAASSVAASTSSAAAAASSSAATGSNNAGTGGAAGNNAGSATNATANNPDAQNSLTLLTSQIQTGFQQDGNETPAAGQVASLTSNNNFINFCSGKSVPLTNGQQVKTGSCNAAPMGVIAATTNMPSSKFVFPTNGGTVPANKNFTVQMAISNLETGNFVNAEANYFAAPQQVNAQGQIIGHSHIVIEKLTSATQTTPTDPNTFAFFKGLNDPATNGVLSATVANGLPAGTYRLSSINSAANHQPVLVAVAQHGALDDMIYFTAQ